MSLSIGHKIVVPYVVLVVFTGVIGSAVVMADLTATTTTAFDGSLLRAASQAAGHLALLEGDRVAEERAAANSIGVPEAVLAGKADVLTALLAPLVANAQPEKPVLRMLDASGREIDVIGQAAPSGRVPPAAEVTAFASEPAVRSVLAGATDQFGDKYFFERLEPGGPFFYWAGPVVRNGQVVGAALVGQSLADIASNIRGSGSGDLAFYRPDGKILESTLSGFPSLTPAVVASITPDHPLRLTSRVNGHTMGVLVTPMMMRSRPVGFLGAAINADQLQDSLDSVRAILAVLFGLLALLAIAVGMLLAGRITSPVSRLVAAMRAVAAGDLRRRAGPAGTDEIGWLTTAFNEMAAGLEEKTLALEATCFSSLAALARAIDARDPYTFEHSARVAEISAEIAQDMSLSAIEQAMLRRSGVLHDVGKIGIEDRILTKQGPLTDEEWVTIRRHPAIGHDMLKDVAFLRASLDGIRHHHERWDGEGYPDGLQGEAIPLQARIVSVADTLDAMTSDRAYRKGFSFDFAVRTIVNGAGSQFDPVVVKAMQERVDVIEALIKRSRSAPMPHAGDIHWRDEAA